MRPIVAIYLAAGLTLAFGLALTANHGYRAHTTRYAITALKPEGDDLARLQGIQRDSYETAAWSLALVVMQAVIIVGAGKLKRQSCAG